MTDPQIAAEGEVTITYSVRDLLDQIKLAQAEGFATLNASLMNKADKSDLSRIEGRLERHSEQLESLERWRRDTELTTSVTTKQRVATWSWRRRIWTIVAALGMMTATILGPYLAIHFHF